MSDFAAESRPIGKLHKPILDKENARSNDEVWLALGIDNFEAVRIKTPVGTMIAPHELKLL